MGGSLGYSVSWIEHFNNAVALAPEDGAVSFAASAAYLDSPKNEDLKKFLCHALRTAPADSLLMKNAMAYGEHYLGKEKLAELLASARKAQGAEGRMKK
jgi:hypothetical protein